MKLDSQAKKMGWSDRLPNYDQKHQRLDLIRPMQLAATAKAAMAKKVIASDVFSC